MSVNPLTARQLEILVMIADGYRDADIASELNLSVKTIKAHNRSAFHALKARTRAQAVAMAIRDGWME